MANTGDRNSCVFLPIVVGVKIFPAVGHIVRAELVVVSDIPDKKNYEWKTTYSYHSEGKTVSFVVH